MIATGNRDRDRTPPLAEPPTRSPVAKSERSGWFFGPVVFLLAAVYVYPLIWTIWLSLHDTRFFDTTGFVGLENYGRLLSTNGILANVWVTAKFSFGSLLMALPAGLGAAVLLQGIRRARWLTRSVLLLPWIVSMATAGIIWSWFLNPDFGPATYVTRSLGLGKLLVFSSPDWALPALIVITAWWTYPLAMLFFIGALQTVPNELYESALVDGAGRWESFRHVTLAYIRNSVVIVTIVLMMMYVNMVTMFIVTTGGGPARATETLSLRIFNQVFSDFNLATAATTSVVMLVMNLGLVALTIRFRRKETIA